MKKNIENFNDKGEHHGYQEWYDNHGLWLRGNHKNHKPIGYTESNWNTKIGQEETEVYFYIK
jgi:hypothetical protein